MKKILLSGLLFASLGMQAQIIGDKIENVPDVFDSGFLPATFTIDNKSYFTVDNTEENYSSGYSGSIQVYDDEFKHIKNVDIYGNLCVLFYYDYSLNSNESVHGLPISQTLFNSDNKYEYVRVVYNSDNGYCSEIVNEDNEVLGSITLASSIDYLDGIGLAKINEKFYFIVSYSTAGMEYIEEWYTFTPGFETDLKKVQAPAGLSVMPSLAKRHQSITIETDDVSKNREVNIVDASGKSVWRQILPAGQKSIRVNAAKLSKGLNVVNVDGEKEKSVKVIVN